MAYSDYISDLVSREGDAWASPLRDSLLGRLYHLALFKEALQAAMEGRPQGLHFVEMAGGAQFAFCYRDVRSVYYDLVLGTRKVKAFPGGYGGPSLREITPPGSLDEFGAAAATEIRSVLPWLLTGKR